MIRVLRVSAFLGVRVGAEKRVGPRWAKWVAEMGRGWDGDQSGFRGEGETG